MTENSSGTCIIVGVGPGLGAALARRFAAGDGTVQAGGRSFPQHHVKCPCRPTNAENDGDPRGWRAADEETANHAGSA